MTQPLNHEPHAVNQDAHSPANPDRRTFTLAGLAAGASALAPGAAQAAGNDIVEMSATALSDAIRTKKVSCREVMQATLAHIAKVNPKVNAIVSMPDTDSLMKQAAEKDAMLARGQRMGWMHGFPLAPKDLAATVGIRTTQGSPIMKDYVPTEDAIIVERMRKSGAIMIGKTNVPEFGMGGHTYNPVFGITGNAWDPTKSAGGSSGGTAVAVALRMCPVADGSDTMGSQRTPAAWNNVFSLRPSFGRVPYGPGPEVFYMHLPTEGPMGRSVTDMAMLLSVQAGYDARTPLSLADDPKQFTRPLARNFKGRKIGWLGNYDGYLPMQKGVMELSEKALKHFETLGMIVEPVKPKFDVARLWPAWLALRSGMMAGSAEEMGIYANPQTRALLKPEAIWEIETGQKMSAVDLWKGTNTRSAWYQEVRRLFQTYDFLVLPTAQVFPFDGKMNWIKEIEGKPMDTYHRWLEIVIGGTMSGSPVVNVPAGFGPGGLPMGLQIIGPSKADFATMQVAHAYDLASGYSKKRSPLLG
jgi:amidase